MASRWEDNIEGRITLKDRIDVGAQVYRPNDPIDGLFGDLRTDHLIAEWESIATEYQIPAMAQFHSFDAEAQKTVRIPVDTRNIEKGLIKVKLDTSERLRALDARGVTNTDTRYNRILDEHILLADQVATRTKVAKNELMATGEVTIKENDINTSVEYGVPAAHTAYTLDLSASADIAAQLQTIIDAAADVGVTITGMMTARQNLTKMRNNAALQKAVNGNIGAGALLRSTALSAYLEDEYGIDNIIINDLKYNEPYKIGKDGRPVAVPKRYFPSNKITFFATNSSGKMGVGLWGNPPETDLAPFLDVAGSAQPYIYLTQWATEDPATLWTKASALFMPVLYNPNSLFIATVTEPDEDTGG